jgi:hypothetical protein
VGHIGKLVGEDIGVHVAKNSEEKEEGAKGDKDAKRGERHRNFHDDNQEFKAIVDKPNFTFADSIAGLNGYVGNGPP